MKTAHARTEEIYCSANGVKLTKPDCLKCALSRNNLCGFDYSLMRYIHEQSPREGIHVTALTGCLRREYYTHNIPAIEFPHDRLVAKLGTAVHNKLEEYQDGNYVGEFPLEAFGIVGTCDVFYKEDGRIIDYKTTRWLNPSKLPYGSHGIQVNIYAAMLREMGFKVSSAAIQYIDMSGPTKCKKCNQAYAPNDKFFGGIACPKCGSTYKDAHLGAVICEVPLNPHEQMVNFIIERRDALSTALDNDTLPAAEVSYLCDYCAYTELCRANANK